MAFVTYGIAGYARLAHRLFSDMRYAHCRRRASRQRLSSYAAMRRLVERVAEPLPVIIPKDYLTLYNFGFAGVGTMQ